MTCSDNTTVSGQTDIEDGHALALLEGVFSENAMPDVALVDDSAKEAFAKSLHDGPVTLKKKKTVLALEDGKEKAEEVAPIEPIEKAKGELVQLTKDIATINGHIMMLESDEYAGSFLPAVIAKRQALDKAFKHLRHHISHGCNIEETYEKAYVVSRSVMDWWVGGGEKRCKGFSEELRPSKNKKAKGKAKAEVKPKAKGKAKAKPA